MTPTCELYSLTGSMSVLSMVDSAGRWRGRNDHGSDPVCDRVCILLNCATAGAAGSRWHWLTCEVELLDCRTTSCGLPFGIRESRAVQASSVTESHWFF